MLLNVLLDFPDNDLESYRDPSRAQPKVQLIFPSSSDTSKDLFSFADSVIEKAPEAKEAIEKAKLQYEALWSEKEAYRRKSESMVNDSTREVKADHHRREIEKYKDKINSLEIQLDRFSRGEKYFSEKYVEKIIIDPTMKKDLALALSTIERYKEKVYQLQLQLEQTKMAERIVEKTVVDPNMKADLERALIAIEKYKAKLSKHKSTTVQTESYELAQLKEQCESLKRANESSSGLAKEMSSLREQLEAAKKDVKGAKQATFAQFTEMLKSSRNAAGLIADITRENGGKPDGLPGVSPVDEETFLRAIASAFSTHEANCLKLREALEEKAKELERLKAYEKDVKGGKVKFAPVDELNNVLAKARTLNSKLIEKVNKEATEKLPEEKVDPPSSDQDEVIERVLQTIARGENYVKMMDSGQQEEKEKFLMLLSAQNKTKDDLLETIRKLVKSADEVNKESHLLYHKISKNTQQAFSVDVSSDNPKILAEGINALDSNSLEVLKEASKEIIYLKTEIENFKKKFLMIIEKDKNGDIQDFIAILNQLVKSKIILKTALVDAGRSVEDEPTLDQRKQPEDYFNLIKANFKQLERYSTEVSDLLKQLRDSKAQVDELKAKLATRDKLIYSEQDLLEILNRSDAVRESCRANERILGVSSRPEPSLSGSPLEKIFKSLADAEASNQNLKDKMADLMNQSSQNEKDKADLGKLLTESLELREKLNRIQGLLTDEKIVDEYNFGASKNTTAQIITDFRMNLTVMKSKSVIIFDTVTLLLAKQPQSADFGEILKVSGAIEDLKKTLKTSFNDLFDDPPEDPFPEGTPEILNTQEFIDACMKNITFSLNIFCTFNTKASNWIHDLTKTCDEHQKQNGKLKYLNSDLTSDIEKKLTLISKLHTKLFYLYLVLEQSKTAPAEAS